MSGFIANGTAAPGASIQSDAFWPAVDPATMRADMRLDGSIAEPRLRASLIAAVSMVNDELSAWQQDKIAAGVEKLEDVAAPQIDGKSRLHHLYLRAVACCATAELIERYRSYDSTTDGNQRADDLTPSIDEMRRDQRWAIRDFLGVGRVTVELI